MKLKTLLPLSLSALILPSCIGSISNVLEPKGPMSEQARQMQQVKSLSSSAGITSEYIQADSLSLIVEAPEDIIDLVETKFADSTLTIGFSKAVNLKNTSVTIKISAPGITNFTATSGSDIVIPAGLNFKGKDISISSSSGANIIAASKVSATNISILSASGSEITIDSIAAETVNAQSSSGSEITIIGTCDTINLLSASGSEISAARLKAMSGTASASSGSEIDCNIANPISIQKASGGSVSNI